jgi:hypothetical protein
MFRPAAQSDVIREHPPQLAIGDLRGLGLRLKATCHPSLWSGCSRNDCSLFTIARSCLDQPLRLSAALNQLLDALDEEVGKWG